MRDFTKELEDLYGYTSPEDYVNRLVRISFSFDWGSSTDGDDFIVQNLPYLQKLSKEEKKLLREEYTKPGDSAENRACRWLQYES